VVSRAGDDLSAECLLSGVKRTLFHAADHVR
jgi:hypothetical protein